MRTADHDLWALRSLANLDDVRLHAAAWLGALERHLLGLRQQRLDPTEVEQGVAAVGLLNDAGDDVAFTVRVFLELAIALGLTDALVHHLTEGLGGDTAKLSSVGGVVALVDPVALFVDVICNELHLHRVGVDAYVDLGGSAWPTLVRHC